MINLKKTAAMLCALIMACGCSKREETETVTASALPVTGEFSVTALKVGKADALVLKTQSHTVLIDCGEKDDGDEIVEFLTENNAEKVDYLFITHFDKDHVGGAAEVIENIDISQIVVPDYENDSKEYQKYISAAQEKGLTPLRLKETMSFVLDDVSFAVYPPLESEYEESDNDFSLAVTAVHGKNSFLFAGDAETVRMQEIVQQVSGEFTYLKVPHHGVYSDYTEEFADKIKPVYAVITCSEKNPAEKKVTDILTAVNAVIYDTSYNSVKTVSDGETLTFTQD